MRTPIIFETFRKIGSLEVEQMKGQEPSCWKSAVSIRKYRVTIEEVPEPDEVLIDRLQKLWKKTTNYRDWEPLQAEAERLGITLKHSDRD
jgi:hypothetical protein